MSRLSLRTRMILLWGLATLFALGLAGWTMAGVLERVVTGGIDQRLDAQLAVMASAIGADGTVDHTLLRERIGALDAGPGWRWQVTGPNGTLGNADFPPLHVPPAPPRPDGTALPPPPVPLEGNDAEGRVHARQLVLQTGGGPVTLTAAAPGAVIDRPIRAALVPFFTAIVALAAILSLAAWIQLRLALRPLATLGGQVAAIRRGERARVDEPQPAELQPLAHELNALAAANVATLAAARQSAANLAHALKTPVATLALTLPPDGTAATQLRRIEGVIRHHLARARAAAVNQRANTPVAAVLADIVAVFGTLHPALGVSTTVPDDLRVAIDAQDLAEILGNLLDNAARHARTRVIVAATRGDAGRVRLTIEDDGPGIPAARRALVLQPGVRLDEGPAGDGFGLAIVQELLTLYGGAVQLADSASGGLAVTLTLPEPA